MMRLSREIRFALADQAQTTVTNSWAGWPSTNLLAPNLTLHCLIEGQVDSQTGYICNIKMLDSLMRGAIAQVKTELNANATAELLISKIFAHCQSAWKSDVKIIRLMLGLSPFLNYSITTEESNMIELTQQFEFSASHRLHCAHLSDQENKDLFGKCNNPEGHGHNYVVEVSVKREPENGQVIELHRFESTVKELVIDVLDHKNLNRDVDHFQQVNPSVENITQTIWNWLDGKFGPAKLSRVRVFETPKTWAEISA